MPHRPVMLGIVGDSAAGKTTITSGIATILGADRVTVVCVDDYHRYNREQRKALDITALHPDCNYIDIMEQHLRALSEGESILKPVYDHKTGDFAAPEYVRPNRFVIVEGLLAFHTERLRDCFHVKVALDPPEELRRQWKVSRDCAKRGYAPEQVLEELRKREADSEAFIRPQKRWADVVVQFYPPEGVTNHERLNVRLTLRPTLPHPDLDAVLTKSGSAKNAMRVKIGREEGRLTEYLDIDGVVDADQAALIEAAIWAQQPELRHLLPDQVGRFCEGQDERRSYPLALAQMFIGYHLLLTRLDKERKLEQARQQIGVAS